MVERNNKSHLVPTEAEIPEPSQNPVRPMGPVSRAEFNELTNQVEDLRHAVRKLTAVTRHLRNEKRQLSSRLWELLGKLDTIAVTEEEIADVISALEEELDDGPN
jgi:chromosome segregation ATPase